MAGRFGGTGLRSLNRRHQRNYLIGSLELYSWRGILRVSRLYADGVFSEAGYQFCKLFDVSSSESVLLY